LTKIEYGLFLSAPEPLRRALKKYLSSANPNDRAAAAWDIMKIKPLPLTALAAICRHEPDQALRETIGNFLAVTVDKEVPTLSDEGKNDDALALLELAAHGGHIDGIGNYVAFLTSNRMLSAAIARWEARDAKTRTDHTVLMYLYRALGDTDSAIRHAKEVD